MTINFNDLIPNDGLIPENPWGKWYNQCGFLMRCSLTPSIHCYGGSRDQFPTCPCCSRKMRFFATFSMEDLVLAAIVGAPKNLRTLRLPFCTCPAQLGITIYEVGEEGNSYSVRHQNTARYEGSGFLIELPEYDGIPLTLKSMTDEEFPITEQAYINNIQISGGGRCQIGGSPLFPSTPIGLLSPSTRQPMNFIASIVNDDSMYEVWNDEKKADLYGLGISGCILYFADWKNGWLGSIYQQ